MRVGRSKVMSIHVERRPAYQHSSLRRAARVQRRIFPFKATTNLKSPNQVASCGAKRCVALRCVALRALRV